MKPIALVVLLQVAVGNSHAVEPRSPHAPDCAALCKSHIRSKCGLGFSCICSSASRESYVLCTVHNCKRDDFALAMQYDDGFLCKSSNSDPSPAAPHISCQTPSPTSHKQNDLSIDMNDGLGKAAASKAALLGSISGFLYRNRHMLLPGLFLMSIFGLLLKSVAGMRKMKMRERVGYVLERCEAAEVKATRHFIIADPEKQAFPSGLKDVLHLQDTGPKPACNCEVVQRVSEILAGCGKSTERETQKPNDDELGLNKPLPLPPLDPN